MKTSKKAMLILAPMLALMMTVVALANPVQGAIAGSGYVYLTDDGATVNYETTDWRIYVEIPAYLGLDQTYWNITVYGEEINGTGSAVQDHYIVTYYIDDGSTNLTKTANLDPIKFYATQEKTYANISIGVSDIGTMVANDSATIYVKIAVDGAPTSYLDTYGTTVVIEETTIGAMMWAIVPPVLGVCLVLIVVGWFGQIFKHIKEHY